MTGTDRLWQRVFGRNPVIFGHFGGAVHDFAGDG